MRSRARRSGSSCSLEKAQDGQRLPGVIGCGACRLRGVLRVDRIPQRRTPTRTGLPRWSELRTVGPTPKIMHGTLAIFECTAGLVDEEFLPPNLGGSGSEEA